MTLFNSCRFYLTLLISTLIFLCRQKNRPWWPLPMAAIPAAGILLMTVVNYCLPNNNQKNLLVFAGSLLVMAAMALACFKIRWEEAVFCAVAGYSVQFIISMCGEMCFHLFSLTTPDFFWCQILITLVAAPLMYFCFGRQLKRGQNLDLDRRLLLLLVVSAVLAEIVLCYNLRLLWNAADGPFHMICDAVLLAMCSFFILLAQFALLVRHNLEDELKIINQMRRKDQAHYQISSETIDLINRKCHDMRHQIRAIGQSVNVSPEALKEMEQSIGIYDAIYQTGCQALDIILTEKSLYCQQNSITISCIADGADLSFISEVDIYSLFGNLLDNAIHALQTVNETERIVGLTIRRRGDLLSINSHNCYSGEVQMQDGLPKTSSKDLSSHGFGAKSIAAIVNKYGGTVSFRAENGVFNLNILFTLTDSP